MRWSFKVARIGGIEVRIHVTFFILLAVLASYYGAQSDARGALKVVIFFLLVFLFALWGFCNGMIDVMDKHFQEELHLNLAQSAWVQFAHYMGYALMALPAGLLTRRLGYKYGIIFGLMLVAVGSNVKP